MIKKEIAKYCLEMVSQLLLPVQLASHLDRSKVKGEAADKFFRFLMVKKSNCCGSLAMVESTKAIVNDGGRRIELD